MASRTRSGDSRPKIIYSVALEGVPTLPLMKTERVVWLSKTVRTHVHTLQGVPAARLTVLVQDGDLNIPHKNWVLQVCEKSGRYDGTVRPELVIRQMPECQVKNWPVGSVCVNTTDSTHTIKIYPVDGSMAKYVEPSWTYTVDRIRSQGDGPHDPARCYMWHWTRYYRMIPRDIAEELAKTFAQSIDAGSIDLNEMNRLASRDLYAQARAMGWRKLTRREQAKYGVSTQWNQTSQLDGLVVDRLSNPSGCGQYTLDAASACVPMLHPTYIVRMQHRRVCRCDKCRVFLD